MTKEFVPYELAVRLKALGFEESCFGGFYDNGDLHIREVDFQSPLEGFCLAPTFSQAFRWFRENHQIFPEVLTDCTTEPKFVFTYNKFFGNPKDLTEQEWGWENNIGQYSELYRTHGEAELACLTKLIEIVEQTKNYEQQETK
jgi:hypothetical protein